MALQVEERLLAALGVAFGRTKPLASRCSSFGAQLPETTASTTTTGTQPA